MSREELHKKNFLLRSVFLLLLGLLNHGFELLVPFTYRCLVIDDDNDKVS